jgi:16S rRNA (cytosine967-C5)-methyltransferase
MNITARQAAFLTLLKIEKDKAYSNIALDSAVKAYSLDSTDCAFISRLVYGVTERKITLDYVFSKFLNQPIKKLKPEILVILRLGTYQLLFMDKIPESAAVNESVLLAKNNKCSFATGLVNAVLRKVAKEGSLILKDIPEEERLSVLYSAPQELVNFLKYHYKENAAEEILRSALQPKNITIRVNTLKTTPEELIEELNNEGVTAEKAFFENALTVKTNGAIYELNAYKKGLFYVEDVSSQICVNELGLKENYKFIDVCSAPGGKSFTASQYMKNRGIIYSCDIHKHRVDLIENGAKRLGIDIIKPTVNDATLFNVDFKDADCVLCDVPCSGLGIIRRKPEIRNKPLDELKSLPPVQLKILDNAARYLKSGGRLVYSTCALNPKENENVCKKFLESHPEFSVITPEFLPQNTFIRDGFVTLMPHINNTDGFFIAVFEKE